MVASDMEVSEQHADRLVRSVVGSIIRGTVQDGSCTISNFGTFERRRRKGRKISSPFSSGVDAEIAEGYRVGFRAGKGFKEAVDERSTG